MMAGGGLPRYEDNQELSRIASVDQGRENRVALLTTPKHELHLNSHGVRYIWMQNPANVLGSMAFKFYI